MDIQFPLTRLARLEGAVTGLPENVSSGILSVVLITEELRDTQRMESVRLGPGRRFRFTNVAPGEPISIPFSIAAREKREMNLRVPRPK